MHTHNKIMLSMLGAFLTIAIITSIIPYVYTPVFVIRHISYFLTAANMFLFLIYNIYLKLKKTYQKPHHLRWINIWTLLSVIGAFFVITIAQNKYIDGEQMVATLCIYYDAYDHEIHRSEFPGSCQAPSVHEQDEQYLYLQFGEMIESKTFIVFTESGKIYGDQMNAFDVSHIVTTRIEITYDQDKRILVFTKDIIDNYNVLYENEYYYRYQHQKQVIENTYGGNLFVSVQSTYESMPYYEVNDEVQTKSTYISLEDMMLVQRMTYELSITQTADNLFQFSLDEYEEKSYLEDIKHSWLFGYWYYTEEGYRLDYNYKQMGEFYPIDIYTYTLIKQNNHLSFTHQIANLYQFVYDFQAVDGSYLIQNREVVSESYPGELNYRLIEQNTYIDIFTQGPYRMYHRLYEDTYGRYLQRLAKKRNIVSKSVHYPLRLQDTRYNYLEVISPSQIPIILSPHPLFDYMDKLKPEGNQ